MNLREVQIKVNGMLTNNRTEINDVQGLISKGVHAEKISKVKAILRDMSNRIDIIDSNTRNNSKHIQQIQDYMLHLEKFGLYIDESKNTGIPSTSTTSTPELVSNISDTNKPVETGQTKSTIKKW